ncbi:hypothetical protein [Actinomadura rudentiformis]|uniref:Uncharacterized protein n=1 Tax=Actinomadura rudentiformis TaxID=359158 RepID=A0A6H9YKF5_9ACTN|nr:hypothetical protein [Actinomadura rudentiformis]KAB2340628.1 hypothetical protein F8566_44745 [Actinomadura rudentiformis]
MVSEREEETIEVAPVVAGCYVVTLRPDEGHVWDAERVPGTDDERERWVAARRQFEEDLARADAALNRSVDRPWWRRGRRLAEIRWLPWFRAEQKARAGEHAALQAQARERYWPVQDEILARVAEVRAARERAAAMARERQARLTAVAHRGVWGWVRKGRTVAHVFRYDVPEARALQKDDKTRGPTRLDALGDELYEWGITKVRWNAATKRAVADDCAAAGYPLTFAEWWAAVAPWEEPDRAPTGWCTNRPPFPVPTRRSRERLEQRERGTGHHSSYGVGDSGGFGSF